MHSPPLSLARIFSLFRGNDRLADARSIRRQSMVGPATDATATATKHRRTVSDTKITITSNKDAPTTDRRRTRTFSLRRKPKNQQVSHIASPLEHTLTQPQFRPTDFPPIPVRRTAARSSIRPATPLRRRSTFHGNSHRRMQRPALTIQTFDLDLDLPRPRARTISSTSVYSNVIIIAPSVTSSQATELGHSNSDDSMPTTPSSSRLDLVTFTPEQSHFYPTQLQSEDTQGSSPPKPIFSFQKAHLELFEGLASLGDLVANNTFSPCV